MRLVRLLIIKQVVNNSIGCDPRQTCPLRLCTLVVKVVYSLLTGKRCSASRTKMALETISASDFQVLEYNRDGG